MDFKEQDIEVRENEHKERVKQHEDTMRLKEHKHGHVATATEANIGTFHFTAKIC